MSVLLAALGMGILAYIGFVLLFPKALPEEGGDYMRQALDRLYEENRQAQNEQITIMRDQLKEESPLVQAVFGARFMQPIYEAALQAGYRNGLSRLVLLMAGVFFLALFILWKVGFGAGAFIIAPLLAYYAPYRHCMGQVHRRNRKFIDQFPDALDMIVRSVRSGFPLSVALQMLAENSENPVREEFRQVVDEIALGRSLQQALGRLASRIHEPDIRFFVVVLSVQQETGGNLAEIVNNLSSVIRKRKQLRNKIRALTSEGRATAWVLGLLPVAVFLALYFLQPGYLSAFWTDSLGQTFFATAVGLIALCAFVVRQMINVEI
jgi:tight adherence protein B